jgi:nitrogen fixation protein NifX
MKFTRIAAVSTDGLNVDEHFGKADRFLVYDLDDQMTLVEERPASALSVGDPGHPFDPDKFGRIAALLKDCSKVYVTQIGTVPADKLKALGIEPVIYRGAIADIATC